MGIQFNSFRKFLVLFLIVLEIKPSVSISLDKFLTLSSKEKKNLDEFKKRVKSRLPHDYMREDVYLIRFLREKDFDVDASEEMLLSTIRWREENKIDDILTEDFSDLEDEYGGYIEGCDNEGRPVLSLNVGDLDIRRAVLAGKGDKLMRFTDRVYEEAAFTVRGMQADGQNVTQVTILFDLSGFSLVSHGCARCIPLYLYILISIQTHYPGYIHKLVAVNTPSYALPFWEIFRPIMSPTLKEILEIFGSDKEKWYNYLLQEIKPSELSKQFGGTRADNLDMYDLRRSKKVFRCETPFWEYITPKSK